MANVLRPPKSKERFRDRSVDEPSPFNLSRIFSADKEDREEQWGKQGTYEAFFDVVLHPQRQAFHAGDLSLSMRAWLTDVRVSPSLFVVKILRYCLQLLLR
jgi:hypothetical protein